MHKIEKKRKKCIFSSSHFLFSNFAHCYMKKASFLITPSFTSFISIESSFAGISHEEHIFVIGHSMLKRAKRPGIFYDGQRNGWPLFACTSKFPAPKVVKIFWGPKVVLTKTLNDFLERQCKVLSLRLRLAPFIERRELSLSKETNQPSLQLKQWICYHFSASNSYSVFHYRIGWPNGRLFSVLVCRSNYAPAN